MQVSHCTVFVSSLSVHLREARQRAPLSSSPRRACVTHFGCGSRQEVEGGMDERDGRE
jgi:hypothetical protein